VIGNIFGAGNTCTNSIHFSSALRNIALGNIEEYTPSNAFLREDGTADYSIVLGNKCKGPIQIVGANSVAAYNVAG
jgi:hypothetical protein